MWWRRTAIGILPASVLLLAATGPAEVSADEVVRRANAAFDGGDLDEADRLYQSAETQSVDPGLIAFNRATLHFNRAQNGEPGMYGEAARRYYWVLSDAACPPERAAKAWYNRGTCLMRQHGATATVYRSAIACLERCLDSDAADAPLRANAAYNLKLAKLLWNEARKKEKSDDNPNRSVPPEDYRDEPPESSGGFDRQLGNSDTGEGNAGGEMPRVVSQHATTAGMKATNVQGHTPVSGPTGQVQPHTDLEEIRSLNPEETRAELRRAGDRLRRDQRIMRMTLYGAERTGLHDW